MEQVKVWKIWKKGDNVTEGDNNSFHVVSFGSVLFVLRLQSSPDVAGLQQYSG
jgi:hypothetical protein